jgi:putative FmdB family regulatory protein
MLTYEYECLSCGRTFEAEQKNSDSPLTSCTLPSSQSAGALCGGKVRRLIPGSTNFVLKGPRWFKDGY